ncbi:hypothetical protein CLV86_2765 [Lacinutrix venerupis]|uniref:hypothetical protein n=1 Tax=Lacinutrix venerupis TaxID=1486034 RepID=UPI000F0EC1EC|nr:hypothetical protein [Lacinutrix venerupis]RLJ60916.1 hypothetical protein CLV86_2765 [Lacinutrix venerupis]
MESIIKNIELMYTPYTKELLIKYVNLQYEEDADFSDESLKTELLWLYENNELDRLILAEYLDSDALKMNISNKTKTNNASSSKPLTQQRLSTLIKSKLEEVDGALYDCTVTDYQLLKSNNGLFNILIPLK